MSDGPFGNDPEIQAKIDTTVPQSARIWNYWLGGKDNYEVDQQAGDQFREIYPGIEDGARAARYFLARAVRHLAGEAGVTQFLDIGTGLPNVDNTHQIAQRVNPQARIVYVDNDPLVLAHARALLTSTPEGVTHYVDADLRDPDTILREAAETLDFSRPVALMLMGILGHIEDYDEARSIVRRLDGRAALRQLPRAVRQHRHQPTRTWRPCGSTTRAARPRTSCAAPKQITAFFDGLELLEPGVVSCPLWRPDADAGGEPAEVDQYGGVALQAVAEAGTGRPQRSARTPVVSAGSRAAPSVRGTMHGRTDSSGHKRHVRRVSGPYAAPACPRPCSGRPS